MQERQIAIAPQRSIVPIPPVVRNILKGPEGEPVSAALVTDTQSKLGLDTLSILDRLDQASDFARAAITKGNYGEAALILKDVSRTMFVLYEALDVMHGTQCRQQES